MKQSSVFHNLIIQRLCRQFRLIPPYLLIIFACTGCCRLWQEIAAPLPNPRDRYFSGTKTCISVAGTFLPPAIIEVPLEIAADTLFLPFDGLLHANFEYINPPLTRLIEKNDIQRLARKLEGGADPNAIDIRHEVTAPVFYAKEKRNLEAVKLLVEHGAKIPAQFFRSYNLEELEIHRYVLRNGIPPETVQDDYFDKNLVYNWLHANQSEVKQIDSLVKLTQLFLEKGFTANAYSKNSRLTALDLVEKDNFLKGADKTELIKLLKSHGAISYPELAEQQTDLPHLKIDGLNIHPKFGQIVDILKKSKESEHYVLSTQYPGIDGPCLVIDYIDNINTTPPRISRLVHRRESPTAWSQTGEPFDMPSCWRLVLTLPDQKIPSRLLPGMPTQNILWEEWYSFPAYEVYLEMNASQMGFIANQGGKLFIRLHRSSFFRDLFELNASAQQQNNLEAQSPVRPKIAEIFIFNSLLKQNHTQHSIVSSTQKEWMEKNAILTKQAGIQGNWWTPNIDGSPCFIFSTHRNNTAVPDSQDDLVPFPNEIFAVIALHKLPWIREDVPQKQQKEEANGRDGTAYWNWKHFESKEEGYYYLLYGDEVSDEELDNMQKLLTMLLEQQSSKP